MNRLESIALFTTVAVAGVALLGSEAGDQVKGVCALLIAVTGFVALICITASAD